MNIAVVVPCFNAESFIGSCLDAIAQQTLRPTEVIVIDDGSSDASIDVIRSAQQPLALLETPRLGGAGARNAGIRAASATWIAFLDADDVWYPNHLERAADVLRGSGAIGYINHYDRITRQGAIETRSSPVTAILEGSGIDDYVQLFTRYRHFVGMSACLVARERALAVGGLREEQARRHDIEFWLRVVAGEHWIFDPVATSAYRKGNPEGLSANAAEAALAGFQAFLMHRHEARDLAAFDAILRERARSALAHGFASGSVGARERAYLEAFDHLGSMHKLVFGSSRRFPCLFRAFRALKLA